MTISQIEKLEGEIETLKSKYKMQSDFLRAAYHEWHGFIRNIISDCEMLVPTLSQSISPDNLIAIQRVNNNVKSLAKSINEIVVTSSMPPDNLAAETFYIAPIVHQLATSLQSIIEQKGLGLRIACSPEIGSAVTDALKLYHILNVLVVNAAKFTERGNVTLSVNRIQLDKTDYIVFEIDDTGIGISQEQSEKLSRVFSQVEFDDIKAFIQDGTIGVGLLMAVRECQKISGKLTVSSRIGKGSRFTLTIPAVIEQR